MAIVNAVNKGASAPAPPTTGDCRVRTIDPIDGVVDTQYVDIGENATPFSHPAHDYLIADSYNNSYDNIQHDMDIGLQYKSSDGKTRLFMTFTNVTGLQPIIYLNKATTAQMDVDWGDGTGLSLSGSGNVAIQKTDPYAAIGDYVITIYCEDAYSFYTYIFNNNTDYNSCLTKCYLGDFVTSIGNTIFYDCKSLKSIVIPNGVISIGDWLFFNCKSLFVFVIPNGVTAIMQYTFRNCDCLKIVSIPATVTVINYRACFDTHSLTSFIFSNNLTTLATYGFYLCFSLEATKIPYGITDIPDSAFHGASSIKSIITIPETVITIGDQAFYGCGAIPSYILLPTIPPSLVGTAFNGINKICKYYIADAQVSDYQGATNWVSFANYMYPISELSEYAGSIFFHSNGGSVVEHIQGTPSEVAGEPDAPTKAGFTFDGWYKDAGLTTAWNWATDIYPATNVTLYAKWI